MILATDKVDKIIPEKPQAEIQCWEGSQGEKSKRAPQLLLQTPISPREGNLKHRVP